MKPPLQIPKASERLPASFPHTEGAFIDWQSSLVGVFLVVVFLAALVLGPPAPEGLPQAPPAALPPWAQATDESKDVPVLARKTSFGNPQDMRAAAPRRMPAEALKSATDL
jgi:hypothetical protein